MKQYAAKDGGLGDVEDAIGACRTVRGRGCRAIGCVSQSCSCRNVHPNIEGVGEETGVCVELWRFEAELGKLAVVVRCGKAWFSCPRPFLPTILCASPRTACNALGITGGSKLIAVGIVKIDVAAVVLQLEADLTIGFVTKCAIGRVVVEIDNLKFAGFYYTCSCRKLKLLGLIRIVSDEKPVQLYV